MDTGYSPQGFVNFVGSLPSGKGVFAHHPSPSDRVAAMTLLLGRNRLSSATPSSPFSTLAQNMSLLPLMPMTSELAAAR